MNRTLQLQIGVLLAVGMGFVLSTWSLGRAEAQQAGPATQPAATQPRPSAGQVLRESSLLLDRSGRIRKTGERYVFASGDGKLTMTLLENRILERVARQLAERSRPFHVLASGTVTEYHNHNFLLLTRITVDTEAMAAASR